MPADPETQRQLWNEAVEALGGQRPTARIIGVSERTMRGLCSGERPIHDGFLRDVAAALIAHADLCRQLERKLSPAFASNLTGEQASGQKHGRRYDHTPASAGDGEN